MATTAPVRNRVEIDGDFEMSTKLSRVLKEIGSFVGSFDRSIEAARQLEALDGMSDQRLAEMGIRRDQIARRVMKDNFDV